MNKLPRKSDAAVGTRTETVGMGASPIPTVSVRVLASARDCEAGFAVPVQSEQAGRALLGRRSARNSGTTTRQQRKGQV